MGLNIAFGEIGNALKPVDQNHILGVADDIYDEAQEKRQSAINSELQAAVEELQGKVSDGTKGMNISGTFNVSSANSSQYNSIFSSMSIGDMRMYLVTDSSGNLPSTTESAVTVTYGGVLSPAFLYFGKSANFGVSVGDILVFAKLNALTNVCRIIPLNDVKAANGDFPGADGLSTVWDKQQINKISGIESTANNALPKSLQLPSRGDGNMNNALQTGVYPWCTLGRPAGSTGAYTCIVKRSTTADSNGFNTIEQTAYGREGELGKVYKRIIFEKNDGSDTQYGEWLEVTNSGGTSDGVGFGIDELSIVLDSNGEFNTESNAIFNAENEFVSLHFRNFEVNSTDPGNEYYIVPKCCVYPPNTENPSLAEVHISWSDAYNIYHAMFTADGLASCDKYKLGGEPITFSSKFFKETTDGLELKLSSQLKVADEGLTLSLSTQFTMDEDGVKIVLRGDAPAMGLFGLTDGFLISLNPDQFERGSNGKIQLKDSVINSGGSSGVSIKLSSQLQEYSDGIGVNIGADIIPDNFFSLSSTPHLGIRLDSNYFLRHPNGYITLKDGSGSNSDGGSSGSIKLSSHLTEYTDGIGVYLGADIPAMNFFSLNSAPQLGILLSSDQFKRSNGVINLNLSDKGMDTWGAMPLALNSIDGQQRLSIRMDTRYFVGETRTDGYGDNVLSLNISDDFSEGEFSNNKWGGLKLSEGIRTKLDAAYNAVSDAPEEYNTLGKLYDLIISLTSQN